MQSKHYWGHLILYPWEFRYKAGPYVSFRFFRIYWLFSINCRISFLSHFSTQLILLALIFPLCPWFHRSQVRIPRHLASLFLPAKEWLCPNRHHPVFMWILQVTRKCSKWTSLLSSRYSHAWYLITTIFRPNWKSFSSWSGFSFSSIRLVFPLSHFHRLASLSLLWSICLALRINRLHWNRPERNFSDQKRMYFPEFSWPRLQDDP